MMGESGGSAERMAQQLRAAGHQESGAWAAGAAGERRVAEVLAALPPEYLVLHDRLLLPGVTESNIDHLVVGPTGLIVIDAKNWGGYVSEYNGTLFQHTVVAGGERHHRPLHRELGRLEWMGTEVATRIRHGATMAICLAGRHAAKFGPPRVVQGVWVVPLPHLATWVQRIGRSPEWDLETLKMLVRTEFPSTTTDPQLLAAIGRDLSQAMVRRPGPQRSRHRAPGGVRHAPRSGARPPATRRTRGRRVGSVRVLVKLALLAVLIWALADGALTALTTAAGEAVAGAAQHAAGGGVAGGAAPRSTPDHLSCDDFDPTTSHVLKASTLTATSTSVGCSWSVAGAETGTAPAIRLLERVGADEKLNPMLERSRESGIPEVHEGYSFGGKTTVYWVAAGVPVSGSKSAPEATRSMTVQVGHKQLGLSEKQARALASAIAKSASGKHAPIPPSD